MLLRVSQCAARAGNLCATYFPLVSVRMAEGVCCSNEHPPVSASQSTFPYGTNPLSAEGLVHGTFPRKPKLTGWLLLTTQTVL
jgi:hypothetical protein